ncbi:MAG: S9 family peptidase [Ferruginibacter sp.]|nr:S9 family peptidase [Ferruginibacter sp.]
MKKLLLFFFIGATIQLTAQNKKPLTHDVYDGWKSVGERMISNDGKYAVYTINPQEGDGELTIHNLTTQAKKTIARGYSAVITQDNRYVVFKIKPIFQETRQAKIKKKKPDEMAKDTLAIVELGKDSVIKLPRVKTFKTPEKAGEWLAYHIEKPLPDTTKKKVAAIDSNKVKMDMLVKIADSVIKKSIDSIKGKIDKAEVIAAAQKAAALIIKNAKDEFSIDVEKDAEGDDPAGGAAVEGTDLIIRKLSTQKEKTFKLVSEYYFDKKGTKLLIETTKNSKDTNSKAYVLLYNLTNEKVDTISKVFNDAKNYVFDEDGNQLAFVAERDSSSKALQKFYKLWYYASPQDTAKLIADKNTVGMKLGNTISENGLLNFSKDGKKLFFGVANIKPPKDTTLVDFELARLDVWHYNDDYLQPQQLKQLDNELKRSYLSVYHIAENKLVQLADENVENVQVVNEGKASYVLGTTSKGNRIQQQWTGRGKQSAYIINTNDGSKKEVVKNEEAFFQPSPMGKYIYWYNPAQKQYFVYNVETATTKNVTAKITVPLYDTENDVPDYPSPAGISGWTANDQYVLINDEYDIWQVEPNATANPINITNGFGRKNKTNYNYVRLDPEKRFINADETVLLRLFNTQIKFAGFANKKVNEVANPSIITNAAVAYGLFTKAKDADVYLFQRSTSASNELYSATALNNPVQLTDVAAQQKEYNWYTAELIKWKMLDGKMSEGLLYKPENFDPKKKYPIIFYFYEKDADNLYRQMSPAPSASTVNVPYFVSNEYLIFDPNIYYKTGEPGQSAYNSIVSAAKYLSKMPWVDSTKMGLQGQSWGGYQTAWLVTRTNMFKAAGAGAPVSNMTSAYGGIRWGAGINRQFQYEKTQSRIGATLWQRPDLYIKNSPLFAADKVNTPVLIMHNDADGAVPWYQGIEYFTALRRLGKKVWMLQYNGEDHNLVERKNRKDLSVRLAQFFDYHLKGAKPAKWLKDGLPATEKGKDWGLKVE